MRACKGEDTVGKRKLRRETLHEVGEQGKRL